MWRYPLQARQHVGFKLFDMVGSVQGYETASGEANGYPTALYTALFWCRAEKVWSTSVPKIPGQIEPRQKVALALWSYSNSVAKLLGAARTEERASDTTTDPRSRGRSLRPL